MAFRSGRGSWISLGAFLGALSFGQAHAADGSAESKAAARDLAVDGIKLAQAGNCKDALPKLERAESLYHAVTILTWVGECQIKEGRLVEGTENLNKVVREELPANSPAAFSDAKKHAAALVAEASPRIGRLTLQIQPANLQNLQVTIDGRPYPTALIGAPGPTDPGTHEIVAQATGYKEARGTVELKDGAREEFSLTLEADPMAPVPADSTAQNPPAEAAPQDAGASGGSTQKTLGWIGVGVGAAALIGGGVTGGMAIGAKGSLADLCPSNTCTTDAGIQKLNEANSLATVSTVLFGAGGALVVAGVVLILTGQSDAPVSAKVGSATFEPRIGLGDVGVSGTF